MGNPKKASNYIPFCKDQGIDNLAGAAKAGVSIQALQVKMPADGVIVFADHGMADMADTTYCVFVQNTTDVSDPGAVALASRLTKQITVTGPDTNDELDILIVGKVARQVG
jgi:hypothetical protein